MTAVKNPARVLSKVLSLPKKRREKDSFPKVEAVFFLYFHAKGGEKMKGLKTLFDEWETHEHRYSWSYDSILNKFYKLLPDTDENEIDEMFGEALLPEAEAAFFAGFKTALSLLSEQPHKGDYL